MAQTAEAKTRGGFKSFRRKTVVGILRAWREIKGTARMAITGEVHADLPKEDMERLAKQMRECLNPKGGEITARARTVELGRTYLNLTEAGRAKFLKMLAEDFDLDREKLARKIVTFQKAATKAEKIKAENDLKEALISPRSIILRQFSGLPNGFKFLVDMRADLLPLIAKDASLKALEYDLKTILSSWFDIGLLDLVEITWNSPAALLEKLIEYEAVHRIRSWDDLKNRLDADRRVYAFFHNKMPLEPLIFVQVALVKGMADNVQVLLDEKSPVMDVEEADTAIFYSISNAQKGLAGISFGNFLIKRVVGQLSDEFKNIKNFVTLSPVPGLRSWLDTQLKSGDGPLLPAEKKDLLALAGKAEAAPALLEMLDSPWPQDKVKSEVLKPILLRLCAQYLLNEKKAGKALDPVAHFHLFNGARLERINWLADNSGKGMKQSAGLMVNYYYKLSDIDDNHEEYATEGAIAAAKGVKGLVK